MSRRAELRRQARREAKPPMDGTVKVTVADASRSERRARQRLTRRHNDGSSKQFGSPLAGRPKTTTVTLGNDGEFVSVGGATINIQPINREEEDAS